MAQALVLGLVSQPMAQANAAQITVIEPAEAARVSLEERAGPLAWAGGTLLRVTTLDGLDSDAAPPDWLVLAVKPQVASAALEGLRAVHPRWVEESTLLSIAAGIPSERLANWVGHRNLVRSMPNTPALIGKGISALFATASVSEAKRAEAEALLRAVGEVLWLASESQLDAVTALSGSGPAYCFLLAEAMSQAGIDMGLSPEQADLLTRCTLEGAGQLLASSTESADTLRTRVTSPGGTTAAAIAVFEREGFRALVGRALRAARDRSEAISKGL